MLLREALDGLALRDDGWYVDATYGRGGHSAPRYWRGSDHTDGCSLWTKIPQAVAHGSRTVRRRPSLHASRTPVSRISATVAGALARRPQRWPGSCSTSESPPRSWINRRAGSASRVDGPLDMRMNTSARADSGRVARRLSRTASSPECCVRYGEEPRAGQIASAIVRERALRRSRRTRSSQTVIAARTLGRQAKGRIHPATLSVPSDPHRVNDELAALERGLAPGARAARAGGRLVAISFHSLEDRIVKRFMAREARGDEAYAGLPEHSAAKRGRGFELVGKLDPAERRRGRAQSARARSAACGSPSATRGRRMNDVADPSSSGCSASRSPRRLSRRRASWVVDAKHERGSCSSSSSSSIASSERLEIDWGRLQIEQSTLGYALAHRSRSRASACSSRRRPTGSSWSSSSRRGDGRRAGQVAVDQRRARALARRRVLLVAFALGALSLEGRLLYLAARQQGVPHRAGERPADPRGADPGASRLADSTAYGEPLAVSTPDRQRSSANPQELKDALDRLRELAAALGQDEDSARAQDHEQPRPRVPVSSIGSCRRRRPSRCSGSGCPA